MKRRALISVFDKTGVVEFARGLAELGFEIVSTGGTLGALAEAGVPAVDIAEVTGFPEVLDGRVKTLHPRIHAGILALRDNDEHMAVLAEHGISPVDIVVNNLYPFKRTISKDGVTLAEAVENIDIGGPSMLRAAAKNYGFVTVLVDPDDYDGVLEELRVNNGVVPRGTNLRLSAKVFEHTAAYDALIAEYMRGAAGLGGVFPERLTLTFELAQGLRYGENPHQAAAFYKEPLVRIDSLAGAEQIWGKELSFCNINDAHGAVELCREFSSPAVVAVKHSTPCGVGVADNVFDAYVKAYTADPVSVYGGIVAVNREVDGATAAEMAKIFLEIVIAPSFSAEALAALKKKKNLRLMIMDIGSSGVSGIDLKKVSGGLLVQERDIFKVSAGDWKVVTKRAPSPEELERLKFAWVLVKHVKSNGIALAKDGQSLGLGGGQVNRIWACKQAIEHCRENFGEKAEGLLRGSALASDAFFPFPDCVEEAYKAGISLIVQPGGSLGDGASIDKCDEYGMCMVFTGERHFRH